MPLSAALAADILAVRKAHPELAGLFSRIAAAWEKDSDAYKAQLTEARRTAESLSWQVNNLRELLEISTKNWQSVQEITQAVTTSAEHYEATWTAALDRLAGQGQATRTEATIAWVAAGILAGGLAVDLIIRR